MSRSHLPADELDARTDRRSTHLYATDAQFRDAAPRTPSPRRSGAPTCRSPTSWPP
ncbi:hypothetical protein ACFWXO_04310 [Kitasatospora sp. NPDC059088]|uniref:hypothetical protein n=1 Tax=Kitasatospora sp. NPDC059088 TaxID=3346722 RepID=UPI003683CF4A